MTGQIHLVFDFFWWRYNVQDVLKHYVKFFEYKTVLLWKSLKHKSWQNIWQTCEAAWYIHLLPPESALQFHTHLSKISATGFSNHYLMSCPTRQAWSLFLIKKPFFLSKIGPGVRGTAGQSGNILADLAVCRARPLPAWKKGCTAIHLSFHHLFLGGDCIWVFCCLPASFSFPGRLFNGFPQSHAGGHRVLFFISSSSDRLWRDFWTAYTDGIFG